MEFKSTIIGLSGSSGSGKTQTCQKLVKALRAEGLQCCGFVSPAVFVGTDKTAIKVRWLENDTERLLMTPLTEESQLVVGRWQIHLDAFEWINRNLADLKGCQAFFCDEIGPLEVLQGKGWIKALDIVDERKYALNVITFRPSLRDYFKQRFRDLVIYDLDNQGDDEKAIRDVNNLFGIG